MELQHISDSHGPCAAHCFFFWFFFEEDTIHHQSNTKHCIAWPVFHVPESDLLPKGGDSSVRRA